MNLLNETIKSISDLDKETSILTEKRVDNLIKPKGSLGRLEDLAIQLSGITGSVINDFSNKSIIVMSSDHGVYEEGVAPDPQEITAMQTPNFARGITGVCALANQSKADVIIVDVGVNSDEVFDGVLDRKIRKGTSNMAKGPAMSKMEAVQSLEIGIDVVNNEIKKGKKLIGIGEMGISNTTASAAIISVFGEFDPSDIVGVGAGLPESKLEHKANIIKKAISINNPDNKDGIDVLSKVGGFEIGAMAGVILGAAAKNIPIVIDGFISYAACLIAINLNQNVKKYLIPSHHSAERGAKKALELLGLEPYFDLKLRLGEGSGAAIAFNFVEAASFVLKDMITFEEADMK